MNKIIPVLIGVFLLALFLPTQVFAPSSSITTSNTLVLCGGGGSLFEPEEFTTSGFDTLFLQIDFNVNFNCNGISQDPTDGIWYAIVEEKVRGRELVTFIPNSTTFDFPSNGADSATPLNIIGGLGATFDTSFFNSLAFTSSGELFATTTRNHPEPNVLSLVNKTTGLATEECVLPLNDDDRHNIFFNYNDGFLYVQSGKGVPDPTGQKLFRITSVAGATCEVSEIVKPNQATVFPLGVETLGSTFNTNDNLIYTQGNFENATFNDFNPYYTISLTGALNIIDDDIAPASSPNCNPDKTSGNFTTFPCVPNTRDFKLKGFAFALNLGVPTDTTPPIITTSVSEPIRISEDSVFDEFQFVSCTDNTMVMSFTTVGTVDTSTPKLYTVDYTCDDDASNVTELQVQYLVKRSSTGGGGTAPSVSAPSAPSAPAPSGVPTLQFTGDEVDRAFDLFATLNQLFAPTEPEPTPPAPTAPTAPTAPAVPTESFIDAIRSFFASLFG